MWQTWSTAREDKFTASSLVLEQQNVSNVQIRIQRQSCQDGSGHMISTMCLSQPITWLLADCTFDRPRCFSALVFWLGVTVNRCCRSLPDFRLLLLLFVSEENDAFFQFLMPQMSPGVSLAKRTLCGGAVSMYSLLAVSRVLCALVKLWLLFTFAWPTKNVASCR